MQEANENLPLEFKCPNCHNVVKVTFGYWKYGRQGKCPICNKMVRMQRNADVVSKPGVKHFCKKARRDMSGSYKDGPAFSKGVKNVQE